MLSVDEALQQVLARAAPCAPQVRPCGEALGLVLAEDISSDVDSPPHDKSLVDGYAVVADDLSDGSATLEVLEEVTAGAVPTRPVARGRATRIMTGAPVPNGADAVVMIERTELLTDPNKTPRVRIAAPAVLAGQNIMRRATSLARGDVVLRTGARLRPIELGLLAEVGRVEVCVVDRPTVAVLPTGNELVPPVKVPAAGQIRNSNGPMLAAAAAAAGASPVDLGIAVDDPRQLRTAIERGLQCDLLLISGGVSAGVLDLVPGVLAELGVEQVFHKVDLKPGKPLWFGVLPRSGSHALVFGLPGNPVSSLVCFELFVRPAIGRMAGRDAALEEVSAPLAVEFQQRSDRPTYHPARLVGTGANLTVTPLDWQGSADLRTLVDAGALACFPGGARTYAAGKVIRVLRLPDAR